MNLNGAEAATQLRLASGVESYEARGGRALRTVFGRDGTPRRSAVLMNSGTSADGPADSFDQSWLRARKRPTTMGVRGSVRAVDLFAGCGGLTLGLQEAARSLQLDFQAVLANDVYEPALRVYERNFHGSKAILAPIEELLDGELGSPPTLAERRLLRIVDDVDILIGGPPCQGHSDLNNHTRRDDPKNELYLRMARYCEIARPRHVIIENVPGVLHDRQGVAQRTWAQLELQGYRVATGILNAQDFGAAQSRKRSITLASLELDPKIREVVQDYASSPRPLRWAIEDLENIPPTTTYDSAPEPRPHSKERIDYLFDNDLFDLPDAKRPDCHRLKTHSYVSMYGRMRYDLPAQTLTTGFGVMGRGRYVHPTQRRTITPHEAARIQGFPDFFDFGDVSRTQMHTLIGNAVPSRLGYVLGGYLLR